MSLLRDLAQMLPLEVWILLGMFLLFIGTKYLQRFRLPSPISAIAIGVFCAWIYPPIARDNLLTMFSILGISSLFLFAGLEVEVSDLKRDKRKLSLLIVAFLASLWAIQMALAWFNWMSYRATWIFALGLLTPSAGFILDFTSQFVDDLEQRRWIKQTVIAVEIVALVVLFVLMQSVSAPKLLGSLALFAGLILALPRVFNIFSKRLLPYAPKSEFAFLILMASAIALFTKAIGVYYLLGAFAVGMASRPFIQGLPKDEQHKLIHAIEVFASFFVMFYFFAAGTTVTAGDLTLAALLTGLTLVVILVPLRFGFFKLYHLFCFPKSSVTHASTRHSFTLMPTLVFGLVMVQILKTYFNVPPHLIGGLMVYTLASTLIPGLLRDKSLAEGTSLESLESRLSHLDLEDIATHAHVEHNSNGDERREQ